MSSEQDRGNKGLMGVFCGLVLLIIVLVVGIVVFRMNNGGGVGEDELEITEEDLIEGETMEDARKRISTGAELEKNKNEIEEKVGELLEADEVDVDAVNELYNEGIEKAIQLDRKDYAVELILSRNEAFLSKNMKREALDAMIAVDVEMFDNVEKYYYYSEIIELAEKLNDKELVAHYTDERKAIEADYIRQNEERDEFVEAIGSEEDAWYDKEEERE